MKIINDIRNEYSPAAVDAFVILYPLYILYVIGEGIIRTIVWTFNPDVSLYAKWELLGSLFTWGAAIYVSLILFQFLVRVFKYLSKNPQNVGAVLGLASIPAIIAWFTFVF